MYEIKLTTKLAWAIIDQLQVPFMDLDSDLARLFPRREVSADSEYDLTRTPLKRIHHDTKDNDTSIAGVDDTPRSNSDKKKKKRTKKVKLSLYLSINDNAITS